MKEKIVFFGAGPYVVPIIEALSENFTLALVVTTGKDGPVVAYCKANNIEYQSVSSLSIVNGQLSMVNCRIAVLAYFGLILPNEVLKMFELGIINVHPSLLPKYRGATPGQAAILAGDSTTGVTIIKLDEEVDHGPILAQVEEKIEPNDTSETLYRRLFKKGAELLSQVLPKYITGELKPIVQDHSKATFTDRLTRQSGFIDLNDERHAAGDKLYRMIRAYYPWPGAWFKTKLNGIERTVKLLPDQKIQVGGGNVMSQKDFANGYPEGEEIFEKLNLL